MSYQNLNNAYGFIENYTENNVIIDKELDGTGIDDRFIGVDPTWEQGEAEVVYKYLDPNICTSVLEIGAGSGKVSHYINRKLKDPTKHYVVEPGAENFAAPWRTAAAGPVAAGRVRRQPPKSSAATLSLSAGR